MIKVDIKNMELPVFDIIQATPYCIPLKKGVCLYFEIPSVNQYFKFEAQYLKIIHKYLVLFSGVNFLELKDFKDKKLKEQFLKELKYAFQHEKFKAEFRKIIKEYFTMTLKRNFISRIISWNKLRKIMNVADIFEVCYLMMFIHCLIENVKSFFFTGGKKDGSGDLGDLFFFFECPPFNKNRAEILAMPITYAMLMIEKYNSQQRKNAKR